MYKDFDVLVSNWDGSPEKEKDRYTLIGIAAEMFGYENIIPLVAGCAVYGYSINGPDAIRLKCEEFGVDIVIN